MNRAELRAMMAVVLRSTIHPNGDPTATPEQRTAYAVEQTDALLAALGQCPVLNARESANQALLDAEALVDRLTQEVQRLRLDLDHEAGLRLGAQLEAEDLRRQVRAIREVQG